jgi:hypothetical protein
MEAGWRSEDEATGCWRSWAFALPDFEGEGAGETRLSMSESVELDSRWLWTRDDEDCRAIVLFVEGTTATGITALPESAWELEASMTGTGDAMEATAS